MYQNHQNNELMISKLYHHYLQNQQGKLNNTYRFDVVILTGPVNSAKIEWIKNAFEA